VDDLAEACIFLMENYSSDISINVSSGTEVSIRNLAEMIQKIVGYQGEISFDTSMPDGAMSKLSDNSRIKALGWSPKIGLEQGLQKTYGEFLLQTSQ
jgi:GDP-L-fucose synthase